MSHIAHQAGYPLGSNLSLERCGVAIAHLLPVISLAQPYLRDDGIGTDDTGTARSPTLPRPRMVMHNLRQCGGSTSCRHLRSVQFWTEGIVGTVLRPMRLYQRLHRRGLTQFLHLGPPHAQRVYIPHVGRQIILKALGWVDLELRVERIAYNGAMRTVFARNDDKTFVVLGSKHVIFGRCIPFGIGKQGGIDQIERLERLSFLYLVSPFLGIVESCSQHTCLTFIQRTCCRSRYHDKQ